jgi:hypothetical protein
MFMLSPRMVRSPSRQSQPIEPLASEGTFDLCSWLGFLHVTGAAVALAVVAEGTIVGLTATATAAIAAVATLAAAAITARPASTNLAGLANASRLGK